MDEIRIVLFFAMFAVLGWRDFRNRMIDDKIFIVFGCAGAVLYMFDWQSVTAYEYTVVVCSCSGAIVVRALRLAGTADMFAIMAGSIIYPIHLGVVPTMFTVFVFGMVAAGMCMICGNVLLNSLDAFNRGRVFGDVSDKGWRKCLAFFIVHRQRKFDKHAYLAEGTADGKRVLALRPKPVNREFAPLSETQYVEFAMPFLTFAAVFASLIVILELTVPASVDPSSFI